MTIAFALEYPLAMKGGVSVLVEELIRQMHSSTRIVLISPDDPARLQEHPLAAAIAKHIPIRWEQRLSMRSLAEQISSASVDLVHIHCGGIYGWGNRWPGQSLPHALKKLGIPNIWTDHLVVSPLNGYCGPTKPLWFKLALLPVTWLGKLHQIHCSETEVAVSDHDAEKLKRWYAPLRRKVRRIYHSILPDRPLGEEPPPSAARSQVILSVGHVAMRKGQHVLAEAFSRIASKHPDWVLRIAGHDSGDGCWQEIERIRQSAHLEKRIELLGDRSDRISQMEMASIFVQPSRWEALGLALQEALFSGCACIGTSAGGIPELISEGVNGFLVPPDDASSLALRLEELIRSPKQREIFSRAGAQLVREKDMSAALMGRQYMSLYGETGSATPASQHRT
jgi:glycosyltransferase involved in cell wall biosynthesis